MIGKHLSHYLIESELGRGGMGIVYRAKDTKLDRTVAIKVLPSAALASDDDRARFYREAKAAAALTHPHIAIIHGVDEVVPEGAPRGTEPSPFIAMEFIDGQTLEDRIKEGPLELDEAVRIAGEIASALKLAHENEIVHRDIKSANVMLAKDGSAKVLDFGLAQTAQSTKLTRLGSTLGTAAYMSPEQARGEAVDRRSDLWSLGVVLYEMISGRPPFSTEYEQAALYSILNEEQDPLTALRTGVPMNLEWIVNKCLAKQADDRYQSASDLIVDLRNLDINATTMSRVTSTSERPAVSSVQGPSASNAPNSALKYAIAAAVGAALVIVAWVFSPSETVRTSEPPIRLSHSIESSVVPSYVEISHDGLNVAYVLPDGVHILDLSSGTTRFMEETENTTVIEFSPDDSELLLTKTVSIDRVPVSGGTPLEVVQTTEGAPRSAWGPDGWIIYEDNQNIFKYSKLSGERIQLTTKDVSAGEDDYDWPTMLPDGRTVMATLELIGADPQVIFIDFESGDVLKKLNFSGFALQYHEPGYLTGIVEGEGLVSVPFDLEKLSFTGPRRSIISDATAPLVSISANGTVVYAESDPLGPDAVLESRPAILTFPGFKEFLQIPPGYYSDFRLSPDEKKVVYAKNGTGGRTYQRQIFVYDFETKQNRAITRLHLVERPVWTMDSDSIAYLVSVVADGPQEILVQAADGSGEARRLFTGSSRYEGFDLAPDGIHLVRVAYSGPDIGLLRYSDFLKNDVITLAGAKLPADIQNPRISPDGKFVAYQEDIIVAVQAVDGSGTAQHASNGFAEYPQWSENGKFFFYVSFQGMVLRFNTAPGATFSIQEGFEEVAVLGANPPYFDVFSDGERAIIGELVTEDTTVATDSTSVTSFPLHFVFNWYEELERSAPTRQ